MDNDSPVYNLAKIRKLGCIAEKEHITLTNYEEKTNRKIAESDIGELLNIALL